MNAVTAIYKLHPVTDNPIFEGFGSGSAPSVLGRSGIRDDFYPIDRNDWNWTIEPLSHVWTPLTVVGRVRSFNDFPCISMMIPAFSRRAIEGLSDMLDANGELLALRFEDLDYCVYNCRTIVEILDHDKCKARWMSDRRPSPALSIQWFAVREELVQQLTIFRMRELCNHVFVTNRFVSRVRERGLNGFDFVQVWPYPEDVDYELEYAKSRRARVTKESADPSLHAVKAESLAIDFPLSQQKMTKSEKLMLSSFQDELDAQLDTRSLDDPYYGSLEGRATRRSVSRLILSCPDSSRLLAKLEPWIRQIAWHTRPIVYVRRGSWDDQSAPEERITF